MAASKYRGLGNPFAATAITPLLVLAAYQWLAQLQIDVQTRKIGLQLIACTLASTILSVATYRLTLHPLAKYPGPWWAGVTDWYNVYRCLTGDRHIDFYRIHQKYGQFVRFGPNRISINTNTALRDIYAVNANNQKSHYYDSYKHFFKVPMSMTTIDKKAHSFKRRIIARALTNRAPESEELMIRNIRTFCRMLVDNPANDDWNSAKDMTTLVAYVTSDIMSDATFSRNWNMLNSKENRYIVELLATGVLGVNMSGYMPAILALKLDKVFFPHIVRQVYKFEELSRAQSDWRAQQPRSANHRDLFAALLDARDPETGLGFTHEENISEAGLLIIAGSDTMATGITSTIFYLLHYPLTYERVVAEVRCAFGDVEDIKAGSALNNCTYLKACLDEAMRLTPGVGGLLPRETLSGGIIIDGEFFPQGVDLGVPHYAIHHNAEYYPEPFRFKPERWLIEGSTRKEDVTLAQSAYCPFSLGRASCTGKQIAYQEMTTILARIMWLYDMRLQDASMCEGRRDLGWGRHIREEFQVYDNFTSSHKGPMVEFKPATR